MIQVRFGGKLSDVIDAVKGEIVSPRCTGEAVLEVTDETRYNLGVEPLGGEDAFVVWAQQLALQCVASAFGALAMEKSVLECIENKPALIEATTNLLNGELDPLGVRASVGALEILLSPEEIAVLA
jgi:hypothetical protein